VKLLLAEIRGPNSEAITTGDVYISIIDITDIINPNTIVDGVATTHVGSGIWAYTNPYENPGDIIYLVIFDYSDGIDYEYFVTGVISNESTGDWIIVGAGAIEIGLIESTDNNTIDITMRNGRQIRLNRQ
jgi:hypothetical protein